MAPTVAADTLPHDLEAEEHIVGACLLNQGAIDAVTDTVTPEDFYRHSLGSIYRAILALRADDTPVSVITLAHELDRIGILDEVGGKAKVHELAALVPASGNAKHYARIVSDHARARAVLTATTSVSKAAQNGGLTMHPEVIDQLRHALVLWEGGVEQDRVLPPIVSAADLCATEDPPDLDMVLGPLLLRGSRTIVGADTGQGKTTMNYAMIAAVVNKTGFLRWRGQGGNALIIDLEQGERTAKRRLREAGMEHSDNVDIWLVPDGLALESNRTQRLIVERALQGSGYDVVLLDPHYKAHGGDPNDERDTKTLMAHLDRWRAEHGFALILPTHARKPPVQGRPKLTIHDIAAGSGAVVRGAEVVLGMEISQPGLTKLYFFKHRDGAEDLPGDGNGGEHWTLSFSREKGYGIVDMGSGPRKAPPEAIAEYVRRRGGQAGPQDIAAEFEISVSTLRDRRDALAALGIEYHQNGPHTLYVAAEGLLVETPAAPEPDLPPPGTYDEPWPGGEDEEP